MLDRSIIQETIREMFREAFIETLSAFSPPSAQKSEGNLFQSVVPDLVNEQARGAQVIVTESEEEFVQESDTPTR